MSSDEDSAINTIFQGLGSKVTDQWATLLLTPAFAFWLGAFFAWVTQGGWSSLTTLEKQLNKLTPVELVILTVVIVLVIAVSSNFVQRFNFIMLRALEGYWPSWLNWLADLCKQVRMDAQNKLREKLQELQHKESRSPQEEQMRIKLALKARLFPSDPSDRMPLPLGNILRAAENRPWEKYGLDAVICWPRLWLVLPEATQKELTEARASLNRAILLFLWSVLFLIWIVWAWWVPLVTLLVALLAYWWAMSAAQTYGDLLEAAFDVHRFALYEALRFPCPYNTGEERRYGEEVTTFLYYGKLATAKYYHRTKQ